MKYEKDSTALLVIDPYNDFLSGGGKIWDRLRSVAEANNCIPHMTAVLTAARQAQLRVFYALHRRYRSGDYETWKCHCASAEGRVVAKGLRYGTWGGEIRSEFAPQPGDIVALEPGARAASPTRTWTSSSRGTASRGSSSSGSCTHLVEATVRFAAELGYDVTMVRDATADYSDEAMHAALDVNMPIYASAVVTTSELVKSLSSLVEMRAE